MKQTRTEPDATIGFIRDDDGVVHICNNRWSYCGLVITGPVIEIPDAEDGCRACAVKMQQLMKLATGGTGGAVYAPWG